MQQTTPKSLRLHIALLGRVNAGKSSFLNLITGQDVSITSEIAGTTTDAVEKTQELLPLGPVVWLDTAGFGDETGLGARRLDKTRRALDKADVVVLVCEGSRFGAEEAEIVKEAETRRLPLIKVYNKADLYDDCPADGIKVVSVNKNSRDEVLGELKAALIKVVPEEFIKTPPLLGDLVPPHSVIVMIMPIDKEAPKGRIIMPQVQALRDALDHDNMVVVVKENEYAAALQKLNVKPDLVVCDSQVVDLMVAQTPPDVKCTTFSVLFARIKGDLLKMTEGAAAISSLRDGDKVLIAESCTHHAIDDDIGTVKIPRWLRQKTGCELIIDKVSGCSFPADLNEYSLVIQCGGCMQNRREILSRIGKCEQAGVPITNYGICISELRGVLARVLSPFSAELKEYNRLKNK